MLGDCYEVHANAILESSDDGLRLCHGEVWHDSTGWHGHAWLEKGDLCIDLSNGRQILMKKDMYYKIGKIEQVTTYTREETIKKILETEHWGNWE